MARQLEASGDFKVLRRLRPILDWPATAMSAHATTVTVLILDTETTGLDPAKDAIIELAMLRVQVDSSTGIPAGLVTVYDELEDPGRPIPKEVVAITGIRDEDVKGKQLDDARVAQMLEGVDLVIAHNAAFDRPFMERRFPQFAKVAWACSFAEMDWKAQGQSSSKLESLAQSLGLFYDAHRAEMDCHALLAVLVAPLKAAEAVPDQTDPAPNALARLIANAREPSYQLQATAAPFDSKDLLKARGYRWNADQRVWSVRIGNKPLLQAETEWLLQNVYKRAGVRLNLEILDALNRFSGRAGQMKDHST